MNRSKFEVRKYVCLAFQQAPHGMFRIWKKVIDSLLLQAEIQLLWNEIQFKAYLQLSNKVLLYFKSAKIFSHSLLRISLEFLESGR